MYRKIGLVVAGATASTAAVMYGVRKNEPDRVSEAPIAEVAASPQQRFVSAGRAPSLKEGTSSSSSTQDEKPTQEQKTTAATKVPQKDAPLVKSKLEKPTGNDATQSNTDIQKAVKVNKAKAAKFNPPECEETVCSDKKSLLMAGFNKTSGKANAAKSQTQECPLDRAALGKSTWEFLHTTAAYYPLEPTPEHKVAARQLIDSVAVLYACTYCREHFANEVQEDPPDVSSRAAFSKWLCKRHNQVNKYLEKPIFDCSAEALDLRWRTGCSNVDESLGQSS